MEGLCQPPVNGATGVGGSDQGVGLGGHGPSIPGVTFGGEGPDPGSANGGVASASGGGGDDPNTLEAKGCSCRTVTGEGGAKAGLLALVGVSVLAARRKRQR